MLGVGEAMRLVTLAYPSASDFLAAFEEASGTLLAHTKTEAHFGEKLLVEVAFPRLPNRPLLRAVVREVVEGALRLHIDEADASTLEFLLKVARGELRVENTVHREHKRFPSSLPVEYRRDNHSTRSVLEDLGAGGCFVRAEKAPPLGAQISLDITAPDEPPLHLTGQVAWVREGDSAGFGVEFDNPESPDCRRLRALLRRALGGGYVDLG
jgi:uncharacterized protein (TIGR02266 family)